MEAGSGLKDTKLERHNVGVAGFLDGMQVKSDIRWIPRHIRISGCSVLCAFN
jgi:hypothetical protein